MASASEVSKNSVFDPRIVQTRPQYLVERGAVSIGNTPFQAQTANATNQQFNIMVPSENVFVDRAVDWTSGGVVQFSVSVVVPATKTLDAQQPLVKSGDVALAPFPNHQIVSQMTATINDATTSVNTQDVLNYVLRLSDLKDHRRQRTCPTMLDNTAYYYDSNDLPSSVLSGYQSRYATDAEPNGAFTSWWFCDQTGAILSNTAAGTAIAGSGGALNYYGIPCTHAAAAGTTTYTIFVRWLSTEKLMLPPFIFGDAFELSTGLFGVQNIAIQCNLSSSPARALRLSTGIADKTFKTDGNDATISAVSAVSWSTAVSGSYAPYPSVPYLSVQFLTPALDLPLPAKNICPYMEFNRRITNGIVSIPSTLGNVVDYRGIKSGATTISSSTFTLPNIPDLLMIYAKPTTIGQTLLSDNLNGDSVLGTSWSSFVGDFTLPIQSITLNWDNYPGLLSSHTQYELYKMSINNGLDMDFASWTGESRGSTGVDAAGLQAATSQISAVGGPLVLRPGRDFALSQGQAPGLVGNFTLQFDVAVGNQFKQAIAAGGVSLYLVMVSSGFVETIKGSTRFVKGILTEQDILGATPIAAAAGQDRLVGSAKKHHGVVGNKMHQYV